MKFSPETQRKFRRWRLTISRLPMWVFKRLIVLGSFALIGLIVFWAIQPLNAPSWTGFASQASLNATSVQTTKTLWDWMSLLIIPLSLSVTGIFLNQTLGNRDRKRQEEERREQTLQTYLKEISQLLLDENLYHAKKNDDVRFIAMALTSNVLSRLDGVRKGFVINFLYSVNLISCEQTESGEHKFLPDKPRPIVALAKVDLTNLSLPGGIFGGGSFKSIYAMSCDFGGADLEQIDLSKSMFISCWFQNVSFKKANLSESNFTNSIFIDCNLEDADLSNANLSKVTIFTEDLKRAKNLAGCTLYDGLIYDPNLPLSQQGFDKFLSSKKISRGK